VLLQRIAPGIAAQPRVGLDVFEFCFGERARLAQHVVVDADLADVVQQATEVEGLQFGLGQGELRRPPPDVPRRPCAAKE